MQIPISKDSPPDDKIALFRSLFRGRGDAYPRRFVSRRTARLGYQPACANEWAPGLCDKRSVRCSECPNRRLLPVTNEVIRRHLTGRDETGREFVAGVYPMLLDETCFFLAADFDKEGWPEDVAAYVKTCRGMGLPVAVERSRSGSGAHAWHFFDEAVPATAARKLGSFILTETMESRPDIGLDSYDRFFPNQDTLPHGGFGGLIALPLQRLPREQGNSVFVDESLVPHADQWKYLAAVERISRTQLEALIRDAESRQRVIGVRQVPLDEDESTPWTLLPSRRPKELPPAGPLPDTLQLIIANQIYVAKETLSPGLRNRLVRLAAFQNPEFHRAQAMRLPTYDKPRIIACAEDCPDHIGLPRGLQEGVQKLLADLRIKPIIRDERFHGEALNATFRGVLRPEQQAAADAMAAHDIGDLAATTAFGKTVVAAWLIAERHVNTLVLVHRLQLLEQWVDRLTAFLELPSTAIGRVGGGRRRPTGCLDVALTQSLGRRGVVDDLVGNYGHIVVDECHHVPAASLEQILRQAKARYITGLSATVARKDGHHPIIFMQCGPVRYRVDARKQALSRPFTHAVFVRPTGFRSSVTGAQDLRVRFQDVCDELTRSEARTRLICEDVLAAVGEGRSPVVLTERTDHLDALAERLRPHVRHLVVLRGGMSRKALIENLARLRATPEQEARVLLATGRFVGEGFDDARLDTLFLALPVSWKGTIAQYAGRLHRLHDRKREVRVYDYADLDVPMLARMFDRRCRGYEAIGYAIQLPASAAPGWPADVPLPIDPEWKRDYAGSVRRLISDGVDTPLAHLFRHAARRFEPDAEGVSRARSASEAFLFRRLESLPQTAGKFRLNAVLPIPFDGSGSMEVDLLCAASRLVIELDGEQHMSDAEAYRRDRRKDALLQEAGYLVLRFLVDDLGKRLGDVLDAILRALAHRDSSPSPARRQANSTL